MYSGRALLDEWTRKRCWLDWDFTGVRVLAVLAVLSLGGMTPTPKVKRALIDISAKVEFAKWAGFVYRTNGALKVSGND